MKKFIPYLLILLILGAAAVLVFTARPERRRQLDERVSLRKKDKIPYGTYVAYEGLRELFPVASIVADRQEPGYWDSLSMDEGGQAIIIITPQFLASEFETKKLVEFAAAGNDVFISAAIISEEAKSVFKCGVSYLDIFALFGAEIPQRDTLRVSLVNPPFARNRIYEYPGKRFSGHFYDYNETISTVLGKGEGGFTNFIQFHTGNGNIFLHLAPMAFTNYFLLKDGNIRYYEDMLSLLSPGSKKVLWDEYFLMKRSNANREKKGWFRAFMQHESLRWALLTAIITLLVYALMEMRRRQRPIPVMAKPRNDSLDFVKTIGRLYYDKGDHKNLTRKMASYFLEHVRNRYKIPTSQLNEEFIQQVHYKSGISPDDIRNIVSFIRDMEATDRIGDRQLAYFHRQLESFYNKT